MPEFPPAIAQYFDCINNERWEAFPEVWAEDAELIGVGGHHYRGRDDVISYYPRVLAAFPEHYDDPYTCWPSGDVYTVEIAFRGATNEGTPVTFEAVDVFTLRDGKIARLTTWYDVDAVRETARRPGSRETRIRNIVQRAATRSAFYKARGIAPDAELSSVAPTTPEDVHADPAAFATSQGGAVAVLVPVAGGALPLTHADVHDQIRLLRHALELTGLAGKTISALPLAGFEAAAAAAGSTLLLAGSGANELKLVTLPETGPLGVELPDGSLQLFEDDHVFETVDGRLLATPLGRRGAPVLRFDTGLSR